MHQFSLRGVGSQRRQLLLRLPSSWHNRRCGLPRSAPHRFVAQGASTHSWPQSRNYTYTTRRPQTLSPMTTVYCLCASQVFYLPSASQSTVMSTWPSGSQHFPCCVIGSRVPTRQKPVVLPVPLDRRRICVTSSHRRVILMSMTRTCRIRVLEIPWWPGCQHGLDSHTQGCLH